MKYYYVQLSDHEVCLQAAMMDMIDSALVFHDNGGATTEKTIAMYAAGYWLSVHEIDEKAYNEFMQEQEQSDGGVH